VREIRAEIVLSKMERLLLVRVTFDVIRDEKRVQQQLFANSLRLSKKVRLYLLAQVHFNYPEG
jgi:hypothetical protein